MGINHREWEGMGLKKTVPLISNTDRLRGNLASDKNAKRAIACYNNNCQQEPYQLNLLHE